MHAPGTDRPDTRFGIVALASNPWDGPWMNRQQLLSRLAGKHAIVYSRGLYSIWDRHRADWKAAPNRSHLERCDGVLVDHPSRWFMRVPKLAVADRSVLDKTARRWRNALSQSGYDRLVAHIFHPVFAPYVAHIRPDLLVYHAYDTYSATPGWNDTLAGQQTSLVRAADLVLASSQATCRELDSLGPRQPVHFLPNGADYERFSSVDTSTDGPADLADVPYPRIGYTGNINVKVDLALLSDLAARRPEWQLVVIGGIGRLDEAGTASLGRLRELPNVHLLGHKTPSELPAYVARMDVNTMCYRLDDSVWTHGIYPLKLHEYLAAGKPVVSADVPSVREFADVIAIAHTPDEWIAAIGRHLDNDNTDAVAARRTVARHNSWDKRTETLEALLQRTTGGADRRHG